MIYSIWHQKNEYFKCFLRSHLSLLEGKDKRTEINIRYSTLWRIKSTEFFLRQLSKKEWDIDKVIAITEKEKLSSKTHISHDVPAAVETESCQGKKDVDC